MALTYISQEEFDNCIKRGVDNCKSVTVCLVGKHSTPCLISDTPNRKPILPYLAVYLGKAESAEEADALIAKHFSI